jgi:hypothetical protein
MTIMWEAKAAPGRGADLLAFALAHADPDADVYRSADGRVVVIDSTGRGMPDVPDDLIARPVHAWRFEPVPREPKEP